jgi:hypothetical protein
MRQHAIRFAALGLHKTDSAIRQAANLLDALVN